MSVGKPFNFDLILDNFNIRADQSSIKAYGSGHINDTFFVKNALQKPDYLLQKVNNYVFKDVPGLMRNIELVINHLKQKILFPADAEKQVLTLVNCKNGQTYFKDDDGNYWRMFHFLPNTRSYDLITTSRQAQQGGMAFGRFQSLLSDLDPALLIQTIPDFLNIEKRLKDFQLAIQNNSFGRVSAVTSEIDFLLQRAENMLEILQLGRAGILPLRITHNDTKFNNVLLDQTDHFQCVIDLDTVMPGYVAYDFGDAIRTIINKGAEDEPDLDKVQLNIPLFAAFTQGYLSEAKHFLTGPEVKSLVKGVLLLPYMQAVRFLTDYLQGDVYYKVRFTAHNLQRSRAQMQLVKMLEKQVDALQQIIENEWQPKQ
ncbi:MAG: aminoglycoside phosphotransferase family protein [Sphingobacteriaceae bacterium]|nr:MAG: aminoglycoside phosphotransferase family protein [Sphingobacteriaceae bacterium]